MGTRICEDISAGEQEGSTRTLLFDLADGSPRKSWLPDLNSVASQTPLNQYLYGEDTILPDINRYAQSWFDGNCPHDFAVTLCNGAIDTLERMIAAYLVPGDKFVVEDPCYISSANAIRLAGMQVIGAAVDDEGMMPDALQRALEKGAKAVLITPRAHNPTGVSITAKRAKQLQDVLRQFPDVVVLEDDHFSLLATTEHNSIIPASTRNWAIFRSVSKGLGPDLRMAFVAADKESVKRINTRLAPGMSWVSRVLQALVYTCLTNDTFKKQLVDAKALCKQQRDSLISALSKEGVRFTHAIDGLNVWIPVNTDSKAVAFSLSQKGWLVRPGSSFDVDNVSHAIRVSIQKIEPDTASRFAKDIAVVINEGV
ncbi:aminotransferase class I/II-fold pyridoxal phosphate-dependent enzyme [Alteromonas gracilis]|uniref:aminotransferase class I/II-fold pyridoxal phosphate-dependent enzyme n=1 Tax=Alteromonas gracilis TaxID=1479524 RepID=UPI003219946C